MKKQSAKDIRTKAVHKKLIESGWISDKPREQLSEGDRLDNVEQKLRTLTEDFFSWVLEFPSTSEAQKEIANLQSKERLDSQRFERLLNDDKLLRVTTNERDGGYTFWMK